MRLKEAKKETHKIAKTEKKESEKAQLKIEAQSQAEFQIVSYCEQENQRFSY